MPKKIVNNKCISFRASQDDTLETRTETFDGREYLVVPVVALVEGVLQAMNSADPELALSTEFGKVPGSWNGRPVVMNHPIVNGLPVSANSPTVLEEWSFGYMFNTHLDGDKLKTEAWLDVDKINSLGGEFESTLERIQSGELVEVSTGLFTGTEEVQGKFNGKAYNAIWRNVIPDHLAFLSEGVLGACSGEDGCGVRANNSPSWGEYIMPKSSKASGEATCSCGSDHSELSVAASVGEYSTSLILRASAEGSDEDTYDAFDPVQFLAHSVPDGLVDKDIRALLTAAIRKTTKKYTYVMHFTSTKVIYEEYSEYYDYGIPYLQRSYTINDAKEVILGDDVEEVNLLTEIVPVTTSQMKTNSGDPAMPDKDTKAPVAKPDVKANATNDDETATPEVTEPEVEAVEVVEAAPETPVTNAAKPAASAPRTLSEYINDAPPEMQEMLTSGIRLHNEKKNGMIKALKDSGRCKFDDAYLKSCSLEVLQNLAELAAVPSYEGLAPSVRDNASNDDDAVPAMPQMFTAESA